VRWDGIVAVAGWQWQGGSDSGKSGRVAVGGWQGGSGSGKGGSGEKGAVEF
jgi:hypothetical protein